MEGVDETVVFKEWKDRHVHDFSTIRSKILVTRKCNNRCIYCILDLEAKDMTAETAREMDDFYLEQIKKNHPKQVRDDYLGGEPLMNSGCDYRERLPAVLFLQGMGIDYGFTINDKRNSYYPGDHCKIEGRRPDRSPGQYGRFGRGA